jgi:hypothetical protein
LRLYKKEGFRDKPKRKKPRTPLQLNILAVFPPWGGFQGAGRVTGAKVQRLLMFQNFFLFFFKIFSKLYRYI